MKTTRLLKLGFVACVLSGCAHSYVGFRKASYQEKWSKQLSTKLAEELGPGYSVTTINGPENGFKMEATHFVIGSYSKHGNWVTDFAFYMGGYSDIPYTYSYSGPTSGQTSGSFNFSGIGLDLVWGYQIGSFRPYFGLKRETFNDFDVFNPMTVIILFGQAGVAWEIPLGKSVNLTLQADYAEAVDKPEPVTAANMISGQASLKWGWEK